MKKSNHYQTGFLWVVCGMPASWLMLPWSRKMKWPVAGQENFLRKVSLSIWAPVGIGCPMCFEIFQPLWQNRRWFLPTGKARPSYRIYYGKQDYLDIPATVEKLRVLFDELEPGVATNSLGFWKKGKFKYDTGINRLVYKPGLKWSELIDWQNWWKGFPAAIVFFIGCARAPIFQRTSGLFSARVPGFVFGATPQNTPGPCTTWWITLIWLWARGTQKAACMKWCAA